jgi:hypothetical protein
MSEVNEWWENLGPDTQDWLAVHLKSEIPIDVADQIEAAGGRLVDAARASATREWVGVRFLRPADQRWIEVLTQYE